MPSESPPTPSDPLPFPFVSSLIAGGKELNKVIKSRRQSSYKTKEYLILVDSRSSSTFISSFVVARLGLNQPNLCK
jgi:hypothetical protein